MAMREVTKQTFEDEVKAGSVLVDFSTKWCPPCRALMPALHALAAQGVEVRTIDAEDNRELAEHYDVRAFPTVIVFHDGKPGKRIIGAASKEKLLALL